MSTRKLSASPLVSQQNTFGMQQWSQWGKTVKETENGSATLTQYKDINKKLSFLLTL